MSQLYDTATLVKVLESLDRPSAFLLDTFFPDVITFDTEEIDLDKIAPDGKTLAPLVLPSVPAAGRPISGYTTRKIKPAYVKPKHMVDPDHVFKRRAGERIGGDMSPMARRDAVVADILRLQRDEILRRKVKMARDILLTGQLVLEGESYPKQIVNFQRDASLTKALTTGNRWGDSGVKVMDTLETWAEDVADKGDGAVATTVVMDGKAWKLARNDDAFLKVLDNRRQESGQAELGPISLGRNKVRYVGAVGDFTFWVHNDSFKDDDGVVKKLLPDYTVILGGPDIQGVQAHGAIRDATAGYRPMELYPKMWIPEDPAVEHIMTQSAPMVAPGEPNACLAATVWTP